ncbi:MAG: hypothetical protein ABEJ58_06305 [Halodesulfurarchaeum sp.]
MDLGRLIYAVAQVYVLGLVLASIVSLAWLFDLFQRPSPDIAVLWLAGAGFGALVLLSVLLVQFSRE